jgi:hypothetical protein
MIAIFTGPTLSADVARSILPDATFLPPASQGDIYRLTSRRPRIIGVIDGYFERIPAVWHKEILWAMSQGIHVYGAASMGALRAVELETFGMVGAGKIFSDYKTGVLEDDDEVAVVHGREEDGFRAFSEALVNIRATLNRAAEAHVITGQENQRLQAIAKAQFYPHRTYRTLLEKGLRGGMPHERIERLRLWINEHRIDQKREDAMELLHLIAQRATMPHEPKTVSYVFQRTQIWEESLCQTCRTHINNDGTGGTDSLMDELRLLGRDRYREILDSALLRVLAIQEADYLQITAGGDLLQETARALRSKQLASIDEHELEMASFNELVISEARIETIRKVFATDTEKELPVYLQIQGWFGALMRRARDKQVLLSSRGLDFPDAGTSGKSDTELIDWFFNDCLGKPAPADLHGYAQDLGLAGTDTLLQIIHREYLYRKTSSV